MKYAEFFHLKPMQVALLIFALAGAFMLGRCSGPEPAEEKEPAVEEKTEPVQAEPGSPMDVPVPVPTTVTAKQEEIQFDEQCRAIRLDAQCCIFPFLHPAGGGITICVAPVDQQPREKKEAAVEVEPSSTLDGFAPVLITAMAEQEEIRFDEQCRDIRLDAQCCVFPFLHPAGGGTIICVAPEQKKTFSQSVVLVKSSGKKRRIAPPEQKKALTLSVLLKPSGKKRRIAPPGRFVQKPRRSVQKPGRSAQKLGRSVQKPGRSVQKPGRSVLKTGRSVQKLGRSVQKFVPDIPDGQVAYGGGLVPAMQATVAALEARSILYGIGPLSDCSGIFHRVLQGVKRHCPSHEYPSLEHYRDSRDLARWYHKQGVLILIRNALERPDLIRPGMVFFFGRVGAVYRNFTVKSLLSRRDGIHHVGVVTRVHKDASGKIISYDLFHGHGRRGQTAASITRWHKRTPTRAGYPPFGNGRQQLVAAARLVQP